MQQEEKQEKQEKQEKHSEMQQEEEQEKQEEQARQKLGNIPLSGGHSEMRRVPRHLGRRLGRRDVCTLSEVVS